MTQVVLLELFPQCAAINAQQPRGTGLVALHLPHDYIQQGRFYFSHNHLVQPVNASPIQVFEISLHGYLDAGSQGLVPIFRRNRQP